MLLFLFLILPFFPPGLAISLQSALSAPFELGALLGVLVVWADALSQELLSAADAGIDFFLESEWGMCYTASKEAKRTR
jgi:hypothetical protein